MLNQSEVNKVIHDSIQSELQQCMAAKGFEYPVQPYIADNDFLAKRYGVSPEVAEEIGYQSVDLLLANQDAVMVEPLPEAPAFVDALFGQAGASDGGCVQIAQENVYGGTDDAQRFDGESRFIESLVEEAFQRALGSAQFIDLMLRWSSCMDDKGYDFATRVEVLIVNWPEPRPTTNERETAVADTECLEKVGYATTVLAFEQKAQDELVDENRLRIDEFKLAQDELVDRLLKTRP